MDTGGVNYRPTRHTSNPFVMVIFICLPNDLVELPPHTVIALEKTKNNYSFFFFLSSFLSFFLPFGLRIISIGLWPSFTFWSFDWKQTNKPPKHIQVIRTAVLYTGIRCVEEANQEPKQTEKRKNEKKQERKKNVIKTFLGHRISHRHVRQTKKTSGIPHDDPLLVRCETSVARALNPAQLMGNGVTKSTSHSPPSLRFFFHQKLMSLATTITAPREFRYESNNWKTTITSIRAATTSRTKNSKIQYPVYRYAQVSMPLHTHKNRSQSTGKALLMLYVITVTVHFFGWCDNSGGLLNFRKKVRLYYFLIDY